MSLLQSGNQKLGSVANWSICAGTTCPGKTELCARHCYCKKGNFRRPNVKSAHMDNTLEAAKIALGCCTDMIQEIRQKKVEVVRIHVSGDFYSAPYIRGWIKIAQECPETTFYAFTRSWRKTRMLKALTELAEMPNVHMWWSVDAETHELDGAPPKLKGVRVAYMQVTDDDKVPAYVDLVLRVKRDTVVKFTSNRLVCLAENGMEYDRKMTCSRCKICFRKIKVPRKKRKRCMKS